jgi:hypothetical protein
VLGGVLLRLLWCLRGGDVGDHGISARRWAPCGCDMRGTVDCAKERGHSPLQAHAACNHGAASGGWAAKCRGGLHKLNECLQDSGKGFASW